MRAVQLKEYVKAPSDLRIVDLPDPNPSHSQYVIRVHAAAANFFDLLQIRGKYQHQPPFPWVAGAEFAGTVLYTPTSLSSPRYHPGDEVFGVAQGAFATHIACLEDALHLVPNGWGFDAAAGLPVTASTAYAALTTRAAVSKGEYVLVHAAAGGIGLAAVQIAKALGASVIACVGSELKGRIAQSFGADAVVDYTRDQWWKEVQAATPDREGVDVVIDSVGLIEGSLKCMRWGGRLVIVGFAGGRIEEVRMNRVLLKNVSLMGLHWGTYATKSPDTVDKVWQDLYRMMDDGVFKPTTFNGRNFKGLSTVKDALIALERRETWGKVIVNVHGPDISRL